MWNPWHGCHKCSAGCMNCYVYYLDGTRDKNSSVVLRNKTNFDLPVKRNRQGEYKIPPGTTLGSCFTSDFFIEEADDWRGEAWDMIRRRPDVNFLIPTKRIHRFSECVPEDWNGGWDNVVIAVSCENQEMANKRLPLLLNAEIAHKLIFVSPILEYVDLTEYLRSGQIEQVSVGGESYENARPCDFDWVRRIRADCLKFGVPFDFHQTGSNFVKDGRRYRIKHRDEHSQAKKGMAYLEKTN
ncbi:MAG: phage Gp37/Gp68 family protein [Lachnospiraceae bacterium]|nr:phage Gp37/Gp68 family protein [Ruminococcus sp.]MCM1274798.1 phage Gp37/Gp68 family protein [Lachnospiraceae bacterium]